MIKTFIKLLLLIIIVAIMLNACGGNETTDKKPLLVTSIYPIKLIVENIVGDKEQVVNVLKGNIDPHSYEIKPSDAKLLADAQLIIRVGGGFDAWITKGTDKDKIIELSSFLDTKVHNNDLHFWMSPMTVKSIADKLCEVVVNLDNKNKDIYIENTKKFKKYLDSVHNVNNEFLTSARNEAFIINHNSFKWFNAEFNLDCVGCVEQDVNDIGGPAHLAKLIGIIKNEEVRVIFTEPQMNSKNVQMLVNTTGVKLGTLDPLGLDTNIIASYADLIHWNAEQLNKYLK